MVHVLYVCMYTEYKRSYDLSTEDSAAIVLQGLHSSLQDLFYMFCLEFSG